MLKETAAKGLLNEYQKLRPPEEVEVAVTFTDGKPTNATGGYKRDQLLTWQNEGKVEEFNKATKKIDDIIKDKNLEEIAEILEGKTNKTYLTGAQIKSTYSIYPPNLDDNKIYQYKDTKSGLSGTPIYADISIEDFEDPEVLKQQLYAIYGYDSEDQYYYGTEDGQNYVKQQITK